jgi:hypothetical protein
MAFWSSERIHHEQPKEIKVEEKDGSTSVHHLIDKFEKRRVKSGKYELRLVLLSFAIVICYFIIIRVSRWLYFWMSRRKSK